MSDNRVSSRREFGLELLVSEMRMFVSLYLEASSYDQIPSLIKVDTSRLILKYLKRLFKKYLE